MGYEPPVLDHHTAPAGGPGAERQEYVRREDEHGNLLRTVVALLFAVCGGLAAIFLFFAAMGAIDLGDALVATVVAIVMGLVWFAGFYYRHSTHAGETRLAERRDRERRGF
jgi:hypothetical protein